jgi:hypothetical protein
MWKADWENVVIGVREKIVRISVPVVDSLIFSRSKFFYLGSKLKLTAVLCVCERERERERERV